MTDPATLAQAVRVAEPLFTRFLEGFDDENRVRTAPGLPNHASWTLGHIALTLHRAADVITGFTDPQQLPTDDWVHGDSTAGDPSRYDTESVRFGSIPQADLKAYPRWGRAVQILARSNLKLVRSIEALTSDQLARDIKWGDAEMTAADLVARVLVHGGTHAGQLIDLRRALSLPRVLG